MSPRPLPNPRRARGFSLLEALVTLVIVALIVTLLMQALRQSLDLRSRILRHQSETRVASLQEHWFRDSVGGAIADLPDAFGRTQGSADSLELVTLEPVAADGVSRVRWWLEPVQGGAALHYSDPASPDITVVPGPLREARLRYLGSDGQWTDTWAPVEGDLVELPRMVWLSALTADGNLDWMVPVIADPALAPLLRLDDNGNDGL